MADYGARAVIRLLDSPAGAVHAEYMRSPRVYTITATLTLTFAAVLLVGLLLAQTASAVVPFKTITSAGPLTSVAIGNEGSCQIGYQGDARLELDRKSVV